MVPNLTSTIIVTCVIAALEALSGQLVLVDDPWVPLAVLAIDFVVKAGEYFLTNQASRGGQQRRSLLGHVFLG